MNQTIKDVLLYINNARYILGLDPLSDLPKGRVEDSSSCPLARALNSADVDENWIEIDSEYAAEDIAEIWGVESNIDSCSPLYPKVQTPTLLKEFIQDFDKKLYSEYIEEEV